MRLYHETELAQCASIISSRRAASYTRPYPAEFLPRPDHVNFLQIGGFKGRGVALEFEWTGPVEDIPESMLNINKPDILFRVFHAVDLNANGSFIGKDGFYWHSRIYQETLENLNLVGVTVRDREVGGADYSHVTESWIVTEDEIRGIRATIGDGLQIKVAGGPPPSQLPRRPTPESRDARASSYFQRLWRRFR